MLLITHIHARNSFIIGSQLMKLLRPNKKLRLKLYVVIPLVKFKCVKKQPANGSNVCKSFDFSHADRIFQLRLMFVGL